jgi:hypothetical protein
MKKIALFTIAITMLACQHDRKVILSEEKLPTGQILYTVSDSVPYTFIDSAGKYKIGESVE